MDAQDTKDRRLTKEEAKNIVNLLRSPDSESQEIGFSIIENIEHSKNQLFMYCIMKEANLIYGIHGAKVEKLYTWFTRYFSVSEPLSLKKISEHVKKHHENNPEAIEYFLELLGKEFYSYFTTTQNVDINVSIRNT